MDKTGKWLHCKETIRFKEHWCCSECDRDIIENPIHRNTVTGEFQNFEYCPYCGIKMEKDDLGVVVEEYVNCKVCIHRNVCFGFWESDVVTNEKERSIECMSDHWSLNCENFALDITFGCD